MFHKVVVPLDGSELAEAVIPHVADVIRNGESEVMLLSVAPAARHFAAEMPDIVAGDLAHDLRVEQELLTYLRAVAEPLEGIAGNLQFRVRFGRPAEEVLACAGEIGADLIAMSAHGRSGISRWIFGCVADRVMRGARCPVLMVRSRRRETVKPQPGQSSYQRILVPLDGSRLAEQVVPYVCELVRPDRTSVHLLSVLTTSLTDRAVALMTSYPPGLQLATSAVDSSEAQMQTYLRSVAAVLRQRKADVRIVIRQGVPAEEILAYADNIAADLISMTTHGFSGMTRWVYGDVTGKVLQGTRSPVLLVRPTEPKG